MSVTSEKLYEKFQELVPELMKNIKPNSLSSVCKIKTVEPFLKWVVDNVSRHNCLTEEEIQIAKRVKESGSWLRGQELEDELEKVLNENPDLKEFIDCDLDDLNESLSAYESEKYEYDMDVKHFQFLQAQYKKLKKIEDQLEEQLENDETNLEKQQIEEEFTYCKCENSLKQFDQVCQEFAASLRQLVEIYNDTNKRNVYTWTQVSLDDFTKQLVTYNSYLDMYMKSQFGREIHICKSDLGDTLLNISVSENNENMLNIPMYKNNLSRGKFNQITHTAETEAWKEGLEFLNALSSNGKLKIPQNPVQFRMEIKEIRKKKDFLEGNVEVLNVKLKDAVDKFSELEMNKCLVEVIQNKIEYQKDSFRKTEDFLFLARENGHAYSDLLCLLMSSQHLLIKELYDFAKESRHYLQTEYSLAEKRHETARKLQDEYTQKCHSNVHNIFNKLFIDIIEGDNTQDIYKNIQKYEILVNENKDNQKIYLDKKCLSTMQETVEFDTNVSKLYLKELDNGMTRRFHSTHPTLVSKIEDTTAAVEKCESEFKTMHNRFKEIAKNITEATYEREKKILWQNFVAAPDLVQTKYDALRAKADKSQFL